MADRTSAVEALHELAAAPVLIRPSGPPGPVGDAHRGPPPGAAGTLLILNYDVEDERAFADYRAVATEVIEGALGQLLVSTSGTTHLAEAPRGGTRTVVIWYPSRQEAERRYWSIEYQSILSDRLAATNPHVAMLVDVLPGQWLPHGVDVVSGATKAHGHGLLPATVRRAWRWIGILRRG